MKSMKNIKPAYAVQLGKGVFAGSSSMVHWQCIKCGATSIGSSRPSPTFSGKCPDTASGNHVWQEV